MYMQTGVDGIAIASSTKIESSDGIASDTTYTGTYVYIDA
jgi:hypothetical protein